MGELRHSYENFDVALSNPQFDMVLNKVFAADKTVEMQISFHQKMLQMNWAKFKEDRKYLTVDRSLDVWCHHHNISMQIFANE